MASVNVDTDGEANYVTSVRHTQDVNMVTVMVQVGSVSVIRIGVEFCVIKILITAEHTNHVKMVVHVKILLLINTDALVLKDFLVRLAKKLTTLVLRTLAKTVLFVKKLEKCQFVTVLQVIRDHFVEPI